MGDLYVPNTAKAADLYVPSTAKVAFVSGANGISGHAIVEQLIRKPKTEWRKIVISSRRTLPNYWIDPRIEFVAVDFLDPKEQVAAKLENICRDVTHAFYTSYIHEDDFKLLRDKNVPLFRNFIDVIDAVCPNLERVCLQTGGKHYGVHLGPVQVPLTEDMPRYDDGGYNFYYAQEDYMFEVQKRRGTWSHNIIRPNGIIGFTPHSNGMSEALTIALYFLICREIGEQGMFPGNKYFYDCIDDMSYAPSIADMSIWAVTQDHCKDEAFNHCNGDVIVWRYFWPQLAKYFGLHVPELKFEKTKEKANTLDNELDMYEWAKDKKPVWERIVKKYGGNPQAIEWGTWGFFMWTTGKSWLTIGTTAKARKFGWNRIDDTYDSWIETFRSLENAGILPRMRDVVANGK
ncbi:Nad-dependent epimerase dehydratase [Lasiodiplodia theobromae]|uniref:Nad-dependent epimerase dehydratase n=1 Tax=Lasiodiplodia theobromae TaxID=45133 RepID=UPI0015C3E17F|nr:Nad-dependent epimerase dehydratase [Lasiodiplodia theobromae]KAF4540657.1 Nad-dependent epimerase dehydratase [Lasiodiplodia theobromae]